ncbi:MAG: hypothetical protein ABIH21_02690 [Patescibacteria group bacterium]
MRWEKRDGCTHVFAEGDEDVRGIQLAIGKASAELAGLDERYDDDEMIAGFINGTTLHMDRIAGIPLKTNVYTCEKGHCEINDYPLERDRGEGMVEKILLLAQQKL